MTSLIRQSVPNLMGNEEGYVLQALRSECWHGDGAFTEKVSAWLTDFTGAASCLLTTSCTHALELAALLLELGPGDEVICPSFTFTSTATAIAIRGATPVFVDVRPDTLNLDVEAAASAITERTRAVFAVHYGGIAADPWAMMALCARHGLSLVEDNAHGLGGTWQGRQLGTFGDLAAQSWHDTKNVTCGEGGALLLNDLSLVERAEVLREKGTNRARFLRGQVDKYTWVDQGSSYLPSDVLAALLLGQLEQFDVIQRHRHEIWRTYARELKSWAINHGVHTMTVPEEAVHPAHLFYLIMPSHADQMGIIEHLRRLRIVATFHYQPLDCSPAGLRLGRTPHPCTVTADRSMRLVRLPLHTRLSDSDVARVIEGVTSYNPGR